MHTNGTFPITLRRAKMDDLSRLHTLYIDAIEHTCKADYDDAQREVWKKSVDNTARWQAALQTQYFLIAEINGDMAGFGSLRDGDYIDFMYTAAAHNGKGVASVIYAALQEKAMEQFKLALTSDVSKTARRFFERKGFVVEKENEHVINGVMISNYRMRKELVVG